jgi:nitrogen regulatory protein PII
MDSQLNARKLITVVTEAMLEQEVVHALEKLGVPGYTITDARGKGDRGDRAADWEHLANIRIEIVCEDKLAEAIIEQFQKQFYKDYAMVVYLSDVTVLRPKKFGKREGKS